MGAERACSVSVLCQTADAGFWQYGGCFAQLFYYFLCGGTVFKRLCGKMAVWHKVSRAGQRFSGEHEFYSQIFQ